MKRTFEEWRAEGLRRFGSNEFAWRFVCPACDHVQGVADFQPYKDQGAKPESATFNCIGRYLRGGPRRRWLGGNGPGPCDYTSGGLFDIRPDVVVMPDGKEQKVFAFAVPAATP